MSDRKQTAWAFEYATIRHSDGGYSGWIEDVSFDRPCMPEGSVRNLREFHAAPVLTAAARDVLAERLRQVEVEGFTPVRDDEYLDGELAAAGGSYALHAFDRRIALTPAWWPWQRAWWKPGTPRQMLVKAGALILAAIEQIDRRAAR